MKMTIITKDRLDGSLAKYHFDTKREADAFYDSILKRRHLLRCVWIEPTNQPWKRQRIDIEEREKALREWLSEQKILQSEV